VGAGEVGRGRGQGGDSGQKGDEQEGEFHREGAVGAQNVPFTPIVQSEA
jgi:hypothetical protein